MILEFKVKNFLSIRDEQTFSFEATSDKTLEEHFVVKKGKKRVLKMALVFGANASGKTNMLKALDFLRRAVITNTQGKSNPTNHMPFLLDDNSRNQNGVFDLSFFVGEVLYEYHLEINHKYINNEKLMYYPSIKPALIFDRNYDKESDLTQIEYGSTFKLKASDKNLIQGNTISNMSVIGAYSKLNIQFPELDQAFKYFLNNITDIITPSTNLMNWTSDKIEKSPEAKGFVLDLLNNADFNISDIKVENEELPNNNETKKIITDSFLSQQEKQRLLAQSKVGVRILSFSHRAENNKVFDLPSGMESAGTNQFFGLGGALYHVLNNNNLLLIDEIDNSLHPDLVIHFINTFLVNSEEAQLICTTHDINLLIEQDNIRRDVVWFAEKSNEGSTELFSLSDFKQRKELSFLNAYKTGKLGAKPNLGSIYLNNLKNE